MTENILIEIPLNYPELSLEAQIGGLISSNLALEVENNRLKSENEKLKEMILALSDSKTSSSLQANARVFKGWINEFNGENNG